jgi:ligand-binding SRPBCC domain-containing protein|tara:strand:+ start:765 stop:1232 length:468 start_codon:yes stop_codon:yes gene_type:complete
LTLHRFAGELELAVGLDEAWAFFSDPHNLKDMTPPDMGFKVINDTAHETYAGQIIVHQVRPMFSIPVTWVTEITHYLDRRMFVDEQRFGPYRFWHHQHHFHETENGVLMQDIVHYDVGFGPLGDFLDRIFVRDRISEIFTFRTAVLNDRFGVNSI